MVALEMERGEVKNHAQISDVNSWADGVSIPEMGRRGRPAWAGMCTRVWLV